MYHAIIDSILAARNDPDQIARVAQVAESVKQLDDDQVDQLISQISDFGDDLQAESESVDSEGIYSTNRLDHALQPVIHQLVAREEHQVKSQNLSEDSIPTDDETLNRWSSKRLASIETLYRLTPAESDLRNHLLRWLATANDSEAHDLWVDLICQDPPEHRLGIILAFAPLMASEFQPDPTRLDRLLQEATRHSQIAPAVFDLFNYYFRTQRIEVHPAKPRAAQLIELLGQLSGQLGRIEDGDFPPNVQVHQINQMVSDSVALIVALCDAFALMQEERAVPKLHQSLQLRHRRVQTEAAAALTRLGDDAGKQALIALAEQPIARLRVLAYADELNFQNEISLELQGEIAIAESKLAIWLAEPDQMGLAPTHIELLDNCEMMWPSYDHPVQCYLFKYSYGSGESAHSNIGLCGPLIHAFAADMRHLAVDDLYAAFAGWQAVHNEIFQMTAARAQQAFPNEIKRLQEALRDQELDAVQVQAVGSFFGELVLVASANSQNHSGTVIVDEHDSSWYESGNPQAPIDWQLAFAIWRGKRLLQEFNRSEHS